MTSGDVPPYDNCNGYVIIGYTVDCDVPEKGAGFDTKGEYCLRVSVDWDPKSLADDDQFYLGATRRNGSRDAPHVGSGPTNVDTWFEGGNPNEGGRNDDTQDIADQQAAAVEDAEASGSIPKGLISVQTDGGKRGSCHARIKIWCPSHLDLGAHSEGKFSWFAVSCGMKNDVEIKPAFMPDAPGTGGWTGVTGDRLRKGGVVPLMPGRPIPVGTGDYDPYLDKEFDKRNPRETPKPADPKRGRELRRDTIERRKTPPNPPRSKSHAGRSKEDLCAETVLILGDASAIDGGHFYGVDFGACRAARIIGGDSVAERIDGVAAAALRLGARISKNNGVLSLRGFVDGRQIRVVGIFFRGNSGDWLHLEMSWGGGRKPGAAPRMMAAPFVEESQEFNSPDETEGGWGSETSGTANSGWNDSVGWSTEGSAMARGRGCCQGSWCECHPKARM